MKHISLIVVTTFILLLANGVGAQDAVTVRPSGLWYDGGIPTVDTKSNPITFTIGFMVGTDPVLAGANGFEIFVADVPGSIAGAYIFEPITCTTLNDMSAWWDGGYFNNEFSITGSGADTIGFGGLASSASGIPLGTYDMYTITTSVDLSVEGKFLCLDSCFYPPDSPWLWSTNSGDQFPQWNGPYCYPIRTRPPTPAEFTNLPMCAFLIDHCATFTYQFEGVDPAPEWCDPPGDGSVYFSLVDDGGLSGATMSADGLFNYAPTVADVGPDYQVTVRVATACGAYTDGTFHISFSNQAPVVACQPIQVLAVGSPIDIVITADDVDCDNGTYSILGVDPTPVGLYSIDPITGILTYTPDDADSYVMGFDFTVAYTDGDQTSICNQPVKVVMCSTLIPGDIDMNSEGPNVADLTRLVGILFQSYQVPPCAGITDVDCSGSTNVSDLTYLVAFLFSGGPPPEACK